MDLESTLVRAEALFNRFRRLVDAIDKKENFPTPRSLGSPSSSSHRSETTSIQTTSTGSTVHVASPQPRRDNGKGPEPKDSQGPKKVITPELRRLLSREIEPVPKSSEDGSRSASGLPRK